MTVIAWDGQCLAADKGAINYGLMRTVTKIRQVKTLLVGASGDLSSVNEVMAWVERGLNPADYPKCQQDKESYALLLVIENRRIFLYEMSAVPAEIEDKHFAMGSGRDYAMAAMYCDKTAREAVEIACLFDTGCGMGIDILWAPDI